MATIRARAALFLSVSLASTAAVTALAVSAPAVAGSSSAQNSAQGLRLSGALADRGPVSRAELTGLAQKTVTSTYQTSGGRQSHVYAGPLLRTVLESADPAFTADRHDPLRFAILVTATDGFQAVLAWGEIDSQLENKRVLVALTEDGKKLARPRLVVPRDAHGARQVYDVDRITLLRLSQALAAGPAGSRSAGSGGHGDH